MNETLLEHIEAIVEDRRCHARQWKSEGGKVVGYLSNNIPLELIAAAGMMPFHLNGDPESTTELADEFMEPAFDPITRSIFDSLLKGKFDFVDLIVLPRSNDAQQRLYYYICEIQRKFPQYKLPPVFLLDLLHSPRETTEQHNFLKFREFFNFLESFTGSTIDDHKIREAIASYNSSRNQLNKFNQLRAKPNSSLASHDAYQVYSAAQSMVISKFSQAMDKILAHLETVKPTKLSGNKAKRLILAGNGLDHPGLHKLIDSLGACLVGDYHSFGNHFLVGQVDSEKNPLDALTQHYYRDTKSSRSFILDPQEVVRFAKTQNADGILFHYLQKEEAITWQYPKQLKACCDANIPSMLLTDQKYKIDVDTNKPLLNDFLSRL